MTDNKQKYLYILDAGHGGIIDNVYQTPESDWKKSYFKNKVLLPSRMGTKWLEENCDEKFYEGVFNREVRELLSKKLMERNIKHFFVNDTEKNMPLSQIVYSANIIAAREKRKCVFISIHSNAGGGRGLEVYTSKGFTKADPLGQILAEELHKEFNTSVFRKDLTDKDWDKEADFYVLKYTAMPAVLSENFFYDNYNDFELLKKKETKEKVAHAHFNAILRIESEIIM